MNKPLLHRHLLAWAAVAVLAGLAAPAQAQSSAADGKRAAQRSGKPAKAKAAAVQPKPKAKTPAGAAAAPAAAAAAVPAAAASAPAAPSPADYIVAVVNTEPITNNEVRARVARALREMGERGMVPPPAASLRQQMLERLISERAQLQYARELGLSVDDATLAQAELSIARQNRRAIVP